MGLEDSFQDHPPGFERPRASVTFSCFHRSVTQLIYNPVLSRRTAASQSVPSRKTKPMAKRHTAKRKRTARTRARRVKFLHKPGCTTCAKARNFLERRGYQLNYRDLWEEPLSVGELEKLIGPRDHTEFLNTHSE